MAAMGAAMGANGTNRMDRHTWVSHATDTRTFSGCTVIPIRSARETFNRVSHSRMRTVVLQEGVDPPLRLVFAGGSKYFFAFRKELDRIHEAYTQYMQDMSEERDMNEVYATEQQTLTIKAARLSGTWICLAWLFIDKWDYFPTGHLQRLNEVERLAGHSVTDVANPSIMMDTSRNIFHFGIRIYPVRWVGRDAAPSIGREMHAAMSTTPVDESVTYNDRDRCPLTIYGFLGGIVHREQWIRDVTSIVDVLDCFANTGRINSAALIAAMQLFDQHWSLRALPFNVGTSCTSVMTLLSASDSDEEDGEAED